VAVLSLAPTAVQTPLTRDPEVREGVIKELSAWLKQRLVGKLLSDRAQLMQAQQLATKMAYTLDNRLSRIEAQIQQQNQAYIRRIEELNRELAAAREENRELILERIAQVKAEMEAARAKVLAEADLDTTRLRL
jgi:DNA anti-recombination protein RmuC